VHRRNTLGIAALGLLSITGCKATPEEPTRFVHQESPQLTRAHSEENDERPQESPHAETYRDLVIQYEAAAQKAQQVAEFLENRRARSDIDGSPLISIVPSFEMGDEGHSYGAEVRRSYGGVVTSRFEIEYYSYWSHKDDAKRIKEEVMKKGVTDESVAEAFFSRLRITFNKSRQAQGEFVDYALDGFCDMAIIDGVLYTRDMVDRGGVFQSHYLKEPKKILTTAEVQHAYDRVLDDILAAYTKR